MRIVLLSLCLTVVALGEGASPWTRHEVGGGLILRIDVDSSDPARILVQGPSGWPYATANGGKDWELVTPPVQPRHWDTLGTPVAVGSGALWKGQADALYRSEDWGRSWKDEARFKGMTVAAVAAHASADGPVLVILQEPPANNEVRWSVAVGPEAWKPLLVATTSSSQGGSEPGPNATSVAISPADARTMWCLLTWTDGSKRHLLTSGDGGAHWRRSSPAESIQTLIHDPSDRKSLVASATWSRSEGRRGLFRSEDLGESWKPFLPELDDVGVRALTWAKGGKRLLLGTHGRGLLAVEDGQVKEVGRGLHNRNCSAVVPADEDVVLAGTQHGLFRSADGGEMFAWAGDAVTNLQLWEILADGRDWVACRDFTSGCRISIDGGKTWTTPVVDVPFDATYEAHGTRSLVIALASDSIYSSTDGKAWRKAKGLSEPPATIAFVSPSEMYCVGASGAVFASADGALWKATGATMDLERFGSFPRLVGNADTLVAWATNAIAQSSDKGSTWEVKEFPVPLGRTTCGVVDGEKFLFNSEKEVLRFDWRTGETTSFYQCTGEGAWVADFWVDPQDPRRRIMYVVPRTLSYTSDGGSTWTDLATDLPSYISSRFAVNADDRVFVGCAGALYSRPLPK